MIKKLLVSAVVTLSIIVGGFIAAPSTANAAVDPACDNSGKFLGLPSWYKYLDVGKKSIAGKSEDRCAILGPLDDNGNFDWKAGGGRVALAAIDILLRVGAMVAVGFVIYGGFRFILSQGDPEGIKNARNTILNAVIGLVITIFSTLAVNLLAGVLIQ